MTLGGKDAQPQVGAKWPKTDHKLDFIKPGFHLEQTPRPQHKKQSDYVIAAFGPIIGRYRGRNWIYGNQT